ncbi:MgtC/SapB family protein [Skermania sp. ID1734]|uniref:MgtC/SapB family protein n=1 Tax=Skermania sp. ID1734 TaxID=2597516 RepID=UPI0011815A39|nr:MgtC/SapB family protein [Skermania sp. ID1734]TSE00789.1 MgtC/SapB family protein [Skermania sp. ID1734]
MTLAETTGLLNGSGQGVRQLIELLAAFGLSALIGLERELRSKSAGLRTQTIVGTSAALILLVSKYGFSDVLHVGDVELDPSRVAAQIVSGVGFLGAGLIITRQGTVHGLTTAAAVWETAAIGMAAGAGLILLAIVVTVLHFVIVLGFAPLVRKFPARIRGSVRLHVTYEDGKGVLREIMNTCGARGWSLNSLIADPAGGALDMAEPHAAGPGHVGVTMKLTGTGVQDAARILAGLNGVNAVDHLDDESE